jgi:hypothetical protein
VKTLVVWLGVGDRSNGGWKALVAGFGCESMLIADILEDRHPCLVVVHSAGLWRKKKCTWIGTGDVIETEPNRIESRLPMVFTCKTTHKRW